MKLEFLNSEIEILIKRNNSDNSFEDIVSVSCETNGFNNYQKKNLFKYKIKIKKDTYSGLGVNGNDALWIPFSEQIGLKIFKINKKYSDSFEECSNTLETISKSNSPLFPRIYDFSIEEERNTNVKYMVIFMENIKSEKLSKSKSWKI